MFGLFKDKKESQKEVQLEEVKLIKEDKVQCQEQPTAENVESSAPTIDVKPNIDMDKIINDVTSNKPSVNMSLSREMKNLKKNNYEEIRHKFPKSFTLKNIKTGQVVEINAASSLHACNLVRWRPRHVRIIESNE